MDYRDYRDRIERMVDMYNKGIISKETLMHAAGLENMHPDADAEEDIETDEGDCAREGIDSDFDDFLERTYPIGSLIRPYQKMSMHVANVQLNDAPGFRRTPNLHIPNRTVQVKPMMYWIVVEHRSGWSKIASADGRHSGWHFYVRDYFQLIDDKTIEEYERDKRR